VAPPESVAVTVIVLLPETLETGVQLTVPAPPLLLAFTVEMTEVFDELALTEIEPLDCSASDTLKPTESGVSSGVAWVEIDDRTGAVFDP
jgi:hypothetical protein